MAGVLCPVLLQTCRIHTYVRTCIRIHCKGGKRDFRTYSWPISMPEPMQYIYVRNRKFWYCSGPHVLRGALNWEARRALSTRCHHARRGPRQTAMARVYMRTDAFFYSGSPWGEIETDALRALHPTSRVCSFFFFFLQMDALHRCFVCFFFFFNLP